MRNTLIITLLLTLFSCKDDIVDPQTPSHTSGPRVIVSNEGNFQKGNASLSIYLVESNVYLEKQFNVVNKLPVGDVLNSVKLINGEYWCVVNNSGLIHVIDSATLKLKHTITGFTSPRQICRVSDAKIYVTDLFAGIISVVSPKTYEIVGSIPLSGWTEHCLLAGDRVYVTSSARPYVYLINPGTDQIVDSLLIGNSANSMLRADNATVLILCEGKYGTSELAELYRIDPKARQVTAKYAFAQHHKPKLMRQNPANKKVYLIDNDIYELGPLDYSVKNMVISLTGSTYAFEIDGEGNFYVGDANDFVENGEISVYNGSDFSLKKSFMAGINTNAFVFE